MVRNNKVYVGLNDEEYDEIELRAKEAHLKVSDYVRWFLFNEPQQVYVQQSTQQFQTIPVHASQEAIEKIRQGKKPYFDPYQTARQEEHKKFSESGALGELHNSIRMMAINSENESIAYKRVLKPIPTEETEKLKENREKRKVVVNKAIEKIKSHDEEGALEIIKELQVK